MFTLLYFLSTLLYFKFKNYQTIMIKSLLKNATSKLALIFFLILSVCIQTFAQSREISGTVKDFQGESIIGATVVVKGKTTGTITDTKGIFRIDINEANPTLVVSYIGMKTQEVNVDKSQKNITVILEDGKLELDEVVVIGYGTTTKRDLTGAVSSVNSETINNMPVMNVGQALTGQLAGVHVTTTDGSPDADVKIRVRGGGSITQDNSPLYIVDGFPVDNINDISPSDIQSIDVLKDASSTAIYGARGANGVIIITTKVAKSGKTTISYNAYAQTKSMSKKLTPMGPYEFALYQYEYALLKDVNSLTNFVRNFGVYDDLDIYKGMVGQDWQDQLFGETKISQYHNISIGGGSNETNYNISGTYNDDQGLLIGSSYNRFTLNAKLNHKMNNKLSFYFGTRMSDSNIYGAGTDPNTSSVQVKNAFSYHPVSGKTGWLGTIDDGLNNDISDDINTTSQLYDPVTLINQDYRKRHQFALNLNASATWKISKPLSFKTEYGIDYNYNTENRFYGPFTWNARSDGGGQPMAKLVYEERPRWRNVNTLSYDIKKYKKIHDINLLAGFEIMSQEGSSVNSLSRNFPYDITPENAFATMQLGSAEYTETFIKTPNRLASFFGRGNYSLMDKYLLSLVLRADGSSKFAPGKQWGFFPSAALAWRLSEESFLKKNKTISNLKLRLSYGLAGNNRIDDDMWRQAYQVNASNSVAFGEMPQVYYSFASSVLTNPNLKWETTITRNVGLDFGLWNQRLSGSLEMYQNTTKDLLIKSFIPTQTGFSEMQKNVGQTSNKGIELALNGIILKSRNFTLKGSFNISFNKNLVDKLDGVNSKMFKSDWMGIELKESEDYILQVGQSVGLMYGYVTDGMYTFDDFDYNSATGKYTLKPDVPNDFSVIRPLYVGPGNLKLKKLTPVDPSDPNTYIVGPQDRTVIGDANPIHTGGFNLTAEYKNFDFSAYFNWSYGNDIYNANKILFTTSWKYQYYNLFSDVDSNHRFRYVDDMGAKITDDATLRELNQNATIWSPQMQSPVFHSWAVEDGSFLRLSNVSIGYSLPKKVAAKISLSQCRFYATANNLWILTKYSGYDPEVDSRRNTPLTPGVDYSAYPKSTGFTAGINITFK